MAYDKDRMTFGQFLLLLGLGVVSALLWVWVDPALAVVLGIVSIGTASGGSLSFDPAGSRRSGPGTSTLARTAIQYY